MQDNINLVKYQTEIKNNAPFKEQRLITDLVAELAIALHNKANLENENAGLKLECQNLKFQIAEKERIANEEKNRFMETIKESQMVIQEKNTENARLKLECQNLKFQIANKERTANEEKNRLKESIKESQMVIQEKNAENAELKLKCQNLKFQIADKEKMANEEKICLMESIKESQMVIQEKDTVLVKKDVEKLDEQKKHIIEINKLKIAYCNQKNMFEKREMGLQTEINQLKLKTSELNKQFSLSKHASTSLQHQYDRYKSLLKYAKEIIATLSLALQKCSKRPIACNKECQTSLGDTNIYQHYSSSCSMHSQCVVETDKIVLAELFFKHPSSDDDVEQFFLNLDNESNHSKNDMQCNVSHNSFKNKYN